MFPEVLRNARHQAQRRSISKSWREFKLCKSRASTRLSCTLGNSRSFSATLVHSRLVSSTPGDPRALLVSLERSRRISYAIDDSRTWNFIWIDGSSFVPKLASSLVDSHSNCCLVSYSCTVHSRSLRVWTLFNSSLIEDIILRNS